MSVRYIYVVFSMLLYIYVVQGNPPSVPEMTETEVYDRVARLFLSLCLPAISMLYLYGAIYLCCPGKSSVSA